MYLKGDLTGYVTTTEDEMILPTQEELSKKVKAECLQVAQKFVTDYDIQKHFSMDSNQLEIFIFAFTTQLVHIKSETPTVLDWKTKILRYFPPFKDFTRRAIQHFEQISQMEKNIFAEMKDELRKKQDFSSSDFSREISLANIFANQFAKVKTKSDDIRLLVFLDQQLQLYLTEQGKEFKKVYSNFDVDDYLKKLNGK